MSRDQSPSRLSEREPLLSRDEENHEHENNAVEQAPTKKSNRLPSFIALGVLCVAAILAIVFGFAAPAAVEEYAKEAITFNPTKLSIDSFTDVGVKARVQGVFYLDGSKVHKKSVRDLGRAATWLARKVQSGDAEVQIYLPEYDDVLAGIVRIPPIVLDIRDGHDNFLDIITDLEPGDVHGLKKLAQDFMDGRESVQVKAVASASVRSGVINLGTKTVTQYMKFESVDKPEVPKFDIANLQVTEIGVPGRPHGVKATAKVTAMNKYPVKFDVPPLAFQVLLPDCHKNYLGLGRMSTDLVHILPKQNVTAGVTGLVQQLPTSLTQACPGTDKSPLDHFIGDYLGGKDTTVYISGGDQDEENTPQWIGELLKEMVLPVPVPVHPFDNMIKNFSLSNTHFALPETPESNPTLSSTVHVVVNLPKDINIDVDVGKVRADADVFYKGRKLGRLDLRQWQKANSSVIGNELLIQSEVKNAPLDITDQAVFTDVLQSLIFGKGGADLAIQAKVDVASTTALGEFIVRNIPAKGQIHVKPIGGGGGFEHTVKDISVAGSTKDELILETRVAVNNPTDYSAHVPHVNISIWSNKTRLGYAWGSFDMTPGMNDLTVRASWNTGAVGSELISRYISGFNTTITLKSHEGSVPGLPDPKLSVTVPIPHMFGKFLKETTMHVFSSTATFILFSPIPMYVTNIAAHAYYNGTDIGTIEWEYPFEIEVGDNLTPRLPVSWNTDGGFGLIRDALGGQLKLDAHANVGVKIGQWQQNIWYEAKGLGAKIRI